jgi:hypothetical protein
MVLVDHLKGVKTDDLIADVAFGRHVAAGDMTKSYFDGTKVYVQHILGDTTAKAGAASRAFGFAGSIATRANTNFIPASCRRRTRTPSRASTRYLTRTHRTPISRGSAASCPNGSETGIPDSDILNNPPTGLTASTRRSSAISITAAASITATNQFITNPADVIAFGCMEIRRYANSRVDWGAWISCDRSRIRSVTPDYTTLPQGVGLTGSYYDGAAFTTLKSKRWDPVIEYDLSTGAPALDITPTDFAVRFEGKIRFKYTETYTMYLTHNDSGKLWINNLTTASSSTSRPPARTRRPSRRRPISGTTSRWNGPTRPAIRSSCSNGSRRHRAARSSRRTVFSRKPKRSSDLRRISRFHSGRHFDQFLRSVLFTCNGSYQDIGGKLRFFLDRRHVARRSILTRRIIKNTVKFYPRFTQQELFNLPNRFVASGRDLNDRYLANFDPPLYYDLPELQDIAGRVIEETVIVGNTNRWQALNNLAFYAKQRTAPLVTEFEGMPRRCRCCRAIA